MPVWLLAICILSSANLAQALNRAAGVVRSSGVGPGPGLGAQALSVYPWHVHHTTHSGIAIGFPCRSMPRPCDGSWTMTRGALLCLLELCVLAAFVHYTSDTDGLETRICGCMPKPYGLS